ncbi:hypothetical protein OWM54_41865 [Myxococcus sp. MISCRS1]|uniref:hypothetical protein n=1 Tax=Myxococcus sp. MISCRS1 TaxID=2996786 RepID=UPI00226DDBC2|nr:hypothetical protein [Myxococcus sp. MISCRS1]MCY1003711.1 hypothetical protein [Myxococcus sp. MISCRS1]
MPISSRIVITQGNDTPASAGGAGVGWRVEPADGYPVPTYPVRVRYYRDADTPLDSTMTGPHGRWPGEAFARLELFGPVGMRWLVTVYESNAAWDEDSGSAVLGRVRTYQDTNPGGGPVLVSLTGMREAHDGGSLSTGVRQLTCTLTSVPRLAARPDSAPAPLRVDGDGRLLVAPPPNGPVLLASGTHAPATPGTLELLNPALDTGAYRTLWLRLGPVVLTGGTTPTITPALASVMASGQTINEYGGNSTATGAVAEVVVGPCLSQTFGPSRSFNARVLRVQPVVRIGGTPTAISVPWELYGER